MDEETIDRTVRLLARNRELGNTLEACREEYVPRVCDEETFFLCWQAAGILAGEA